MIALAAALLLWLGGEKPKPSDQSLVLDRGPADVQASANSLEELEGMDPVGELPTIPESIRAPAQLAWDGEWPQKEGYIVVRVVDDMGHPVSLYPVLLAKLDSRGSLYAAESNSGSLMQADDDGWAYFAKSSSRAQLAGQELLYVTSGLGWERDRRVQVPRAWKEPLHLTLEVPTKGVVHVTLVDGAGNPWGEEAQVYTAGSGVWRRYAYTAGPGEYWMHSIPLGEEIRYVVDTGVGGPQTIGVNTLNKRNNVIHLVHEAGSRWPRIRGRLREKGGELLPYKRVKVTLSNRKRVEIQSDGESRFELEIQSEDVDSVLFASALVGRSMDHQRNIELPNLKFNETRELGVVELEPMPFLVRGRVQGATSDSNKSGRVVVAGETGEGNWKILARHFVWAGRPFLITGESARTRLRVWYEPDEIAPPTNEEGKPPRPIRRIVTTAGADGSSNSVISGSTLDRGDNPNGWASSKDWPGALLVAPGTSNVLLGTIPTAQVIGRVKGSKKGRGYVAWNTSSGVTRRARVRDGKFHLVCPSGPGILQVQDSDGKVLMEIEGVTLNSGFDQDEGVRLIQLP